MVVPGGPQTDREHPLAALEQLAAAARRARTAREFSQLLVRLFHDTIPGVDTAAILLCERGRLRLVATAGLDRVADASTSFAVGERFAGRIAAERRPLALAAGELDRVAPGGLPHRKLRALYGVPLVIDDALLGVAYIGSLAAIEIGDADWRMFDQLTGHAALGLAYHRLRAERERGLAERDAFFNAAPAGIALLDEELRFVQVNDALAAMCDCAAAQLVGRRFAEILSPATASATLSQLRRVLERGETLPELPFALADDAKGRALLATSFPIRRPTGEPVAVAVILTDITAHKRMEDALRERERRFRMLADNIPQLAWIADAHGALAWCNERWCQFTGMSPAETMGAGWKRAVHPEHLARIDEGIAHSVAIGEPWEDTFPLRDRAGEYRWFLARSIPIRDSHGRVVNWFGTSTDVTEQRLLDEATVYLSESIEPAVTFPKVARAALPTLADMCCFDVFEDGVIRRAACAHVDSEREQAGPLGLCGRAPAPAASWHPVVRAITTDEVVFLPDLDRLVEAGALGPDRPALFGPTEVSSAIVVPMRAGERRLGALTFAYTQASGRHHTVAQRRAAVELAHRAGIALDNARHYEEARRAVHTRERVLAIVSHDLRNPLGTIELSVARLQQQLGDPAVARHVDIVRRATRRMESLISDLLDMASIQEGKLALTCASLRVADLVDELVESQGPLAHEKGIALELESSLRDEVVWGDRHRLLQVLANLVGNATKFCRAGDRITIRAEASPAQVAIEVSDTGPGISAEALPHLFEAYWADRSSGKRSTGLGLYIAKGIVDAHHGQLSVQSTPGQGSVFRIVLPRGDAAARAGTATPASSVSMERDGGAGATRHA